MKKRWRKGNRLLVRCLRWPLVVFTGSLVLSCATTVRRFDNEPPLWVDPDRGDLPQMPTDYYSGTYADAVDKLGLRPPSQFLTVPRPGEAINVNSIDEVPNSSWFQNRIGWFDLSPARVARAECGDTPTLSMKHGPWTVVGAKPDGANPGFFIEASDGHRYLLKFDGFSQPLRATTADVVGSKIYWAIGYHSVCNEIVYFDPDRLKIDPEATAETELGKGRPITDQDIRTVLSKGLRLKDGRIRASASRFVPGQPLGPFKYEGTRSDDPNDVVPHEDRRELRAAYLPAAWLNHIDARRQNTLNVLIDNGERQYIRHYKIDWGDALGIAWEPDRLARRFGHSYALDFQQMAEDFLTLGLLDRPWNHVERSKVHIFGYYNVRDFVPSKWRGVYPIPAFERRTPNDILWMVRIFSRITDEHIRAIVAEAKLPDPRQSEYLTRVLIGRRDKFFQEYLDQYVPLARFHLVRLSPGDSEQSLCFEDLAIKHGVSEADEAYYRLRFHGGAQLERQLGWIDLTPDRSHPAWSCVPFPLGGTRPAELAGEGARDDHPLRYGILDIWVHQEPTVEPMGQIRLHFYDLGSRRGFRLVGIERPRRMTLPRDG